MKNIYTKILTAALILTPNISFAEGKTLKDLALLVTQYLDIALALIIGLAVVTFVWNVYIYFFTEKDKTEAAKYVMYSIIGFFVILSFWGMVAILTNSIELDNQRPSTVPGNFNFNNGKPSGASNMQNTNNQGEMYNLGGTK